ncbi:hypothetical protein Tco_0981143 [Tanacetum coccineum]
MVAFLQNPVGSEEFHEIVDFLAGSHIRYALTTNPTIYVSLVEQFWQTAIVEIINDGEPHITVTVDEHNFTITEASVRRHLQLADVDGISYMPNTKFFENLSRMGYVSDNEKLTFKKAKFSPQWKFLIHTILHCLSPKKTSWEQFSSNIATAIIYLATNRTFKFSKLIFDGMVKNVESKTKFLMYPRFIQIFLNKQKIFLKKHKAEYVAPTLTNKLFSNMKIGFTGVPVPLFDTMIVHDQPCQGEGLTHIVESQHTPIVSPHTSQLISSHFTSLPENSTQQPTSPPFTEPQIPDSTSTLSHDLLLPGGYTLGSVEGSMKLNELTDLCTKLVGRVTSLETELIKTKQVYGKAITKLVKKVKHLEDKLKSTKVRRKARIVLSEEEEELVSEAPSKQGRMEETKDEGIQEERQEDGYHFDQTLQQQELTPLKDQSVQDQSTSSFEVDLSLLSAAKILTEASTKKIKTYKKRRTSADSSKIRTAEDTAKDIFSTAKDIQGTDEEIARKLHEEEQANSIELQEQERLNLEAAKELQR